MTVALSGWAAAFAALALAGALARRLAQRMELVARACHEVRGPVAAARLGLHTVARPDEASAARIAAIDRELRRAGLALDDLQAAREGRRARDGRTPVSVAELLRETCAAWRPAAAARARTLRVEAPDADPLIPGERLRLAQACANLVANALEHGEGTVTVRAQLSGARLRIEVADEGPGLPAPVPELVRRARNGRGRRGRGLAITAEIAAAHGGRLAAAPSSRGARLVLELPRGAGARSARA